MDKNSLPHLIKARKPELAVLFIAVMLVGFLVSRAALSIGMMLFGANALWDVPPKQWFRHKWWLTGACWVAIYALTWFWSEDKGGWHTTVQLKLPILLLPLAFSFLPPFNTRHLQVLTLMMGFLLLAGASYSLSFLIRDFNYYIKGYNISHLIPTPVYGEYISFSVTCSIYVVWVAATFGKLASRTVKTSAAIIAVLLVAYVHILASKSGIVALYVFGLLYSIYISFALRKYVIGIALLIVIPFALKLSVLYVPTMAERWNHIYFTYQRYLMHDQTGTLGDINRIYSYDIALRLMRQNPWMGTGMGDVLQQMKAGYALWHPEVTDERGMLIPHNQFLVVGVGCGIPAMVLFVIWVFMPLRRLGRNRESFFFFVIWLFLLFELMIEPFLEGQFKIFVFTFFLLLFRQLLPRKALAPGDAQ